MGYKTMQVASVPESDRNQKFAYESSDALASPGNAAADTADIKIAYHTY